MKAKDIIFYVLLLLLIGGCLYIVKLIKSESSECLKNPFIYGAKKMGNIECNCKDFKNSNCPASFYFNDSTFDTPVTNCKTEQKFEFKI